MTWITHTVGIITNAIDELSDAQINELIAVPFRDLPTRNTLDNDDA